MRPAAIAALLLLLISGDALACKVPVFRFALERWEADDYTILYRDAGGAPEIDHHNAVARHDPNIDTKFAAIYPEPAGSGNPFWAGDDAASLLGSPLRVKLLELLASGASTVWILIEGADLDANDATALELRRVLDAAAAGLEIPAGVVRPEQLDSGEVNLADIDAKDVLRSAIPLGIDFQILRLEHGDAREEAFRQMLVGIHPDPAIRATGEALLVPVFGRGRMLEPLPASRLDEEMATIASRYLCGECSCEVKDENPGADILLDADWDALLEGSYTIIDQRLPPLTGAGEFLSGDAPPQHNPPVGAPSQLPRNLFILATAAAVILTLASALMMRPGE